MFLGIEIGGTKLQFGLGDGAGRLVALQRYGVDLSQGGPGIQRQILATVPQLLAENSVRPEAVQGVGIGFGGPVDDATRRVIKSHQVNGWDAFPLASWMEEHFGWPTALGNDADVAGLAESHFGAGRGLSPVFYVTVGSGIGGALILEGKIHRGCGQGAGEVGHLWVDYDLDSPEIVPQAPAWSILEHRASGWAISQAARMPNTEQVAEAAQWGEPAALQVLQRARRRLALALTHVIALCCPRRIVIGGGVSLLGEELFFGPLRREVAQIVFKPFAECYDIQPAALGEAVVVHGALALARQQTDAP
jgi:glucokinase